MQLGHDAIHVGRCHLGEKIGGRRLQLFTGNSSFPFVFAFPFVLRCTRSRRTDSFIVRRESSQSTFEPNSVLLVLVSSNRKFFLQDLFDSMRTKIMSSSGCCVRPSTRQVHCSHISNTVTPGIEAIVNAMTAHNNVSKVQERGCLAFWLLAHNNDANCESIAAKHGIEAIVSAMTAHNNVSKVQERGCLVLMNLSWNESRAVRIQLEGGLVVLEHNPYEFAAKRALQQIKAWTILG
jgi:hypothetical protein